MGKLKIYIQSGAAAMTADDEAFTAETGSLTVFPPMCVHSVSAADGGLPVYSVLKFDLGKFPSISSYSPSPVSIFRYAREKGKPICFMPDETEKMECGRIFTDCVNEMKGFRYGYDVMLRAYIYRLIYMIIRSWESGGLNIRECPAVKETDSSIDNITEYIDRHLNEGIRVADIADECHLSYSAFAVKFRERYGMSCKEYIERMRIYKAEEYLLFTDHDIDYIGQETGFSDCSHFIKSFRKHRGVTPKKFRDMKRS
ncbi:MAG: helix-turn-helix domain-containing protein [Ruminiclostridium sp.]|nr:helix-turn-helix domain-containing protein [Ruminiclostridium sp.]